MWTPRKLRACRQTLISSTFLHFLAEKANGADVRIVYSPVDAVRIAQENPDREVVFFAVGFETTAPA